MGGVSCYVYGPFNAALTPNLLIFNNSQNFHLSKELNKNPNKLHLQGEKKKLFYPVAALRVAVQ